MILDYVLFGSGWLLAQVFVKERLKKKKGVGGRVSPFPVLVPPLFLFSVSLQLLRQF